ncbi:MAG: D-tyrosyl-tRNA(Tyr) deacylase [Succinivibrio sp.]|nr:D-tyrosyl-tRNA(Tyr) deacylase [Succinivibrio sp.]
MIALLQRVRFAKVEVEGQTVADSGPGLLAFIAFEQGDTEAKSHRLLERILNYRMFPDEQDHLNLNLKQVSGTLTLVSQFTLAADTQHGNRPSFDPALPPPLAKQMYAELVEHARQVYPQVESGIFAADMQVSLLNDGPVTFLLKI